MCTDSILIRCADDSLFCKECAETHVAQCATCKNLFPKEKLYQDKHTTKYYCSKEHFPKGMELCTQCHGLFKQRTLIPAQDASGEMVFLCKRCAEENTCECTSCKVKLLRGAGRRVNNEYLCRACFAKLSVECPLCETFKLREDMVWFDLENPPLLICKECRYKKVILPYTHKPKPRFLSTKEDGAYPTFFGIELEVACKELEAGEVAQRFTKEFRNKVDKIFYLKFDRSIGNGFEIVTHPMSFSYLRKELYIRPILEWLSQYVYEDGNGVCGIHVHIDKRQFYTNNEEDSREIMLRNSVFLQKLLIFFYTNYDRIIMFSRRPNREWTDRNCYKLKKERTLMLLQGRGTEDRHACVNINNRNTIEIRVFNGTINFDLFMNFLRFTNYLIEFFREFPKSLFVKEFRNSADEMPNTVSDTWIAFLDYVKTRNYKLWEQLVLIK